MRIALALERKDLYISELLKRNDYFKASQIENDRINLIISLLIILFCNLTKIKSTDDTFEKLTEEEIHNKYFEMSELLKTAREKRRKYTD